MKKFYYSLFAAATMMLAVTSCSQEEDFAQSSNEMTRFSIQLDGATQSRAAGDGTTVDKLYYAVYSKGTDNVVFPYEGQYATADKVNGGWTLDLPLMKSETYDILFWAQKNKENNTAYTFDNLKNITVNYDGVLSNKEDRDAFFNALNGFTASNSEHTIVLRRPFAQLNVATTKTDWDKAKTIYNSNSSTDAAPVTKSSVTVRALATQFNVLNGKATVAEGTDPVTVTFAANELLKDNEGNNEIIKIKQMVEGKEKDVEYTLLAMNYLLPESEKAPNGLDKYEKEDEAKDAVEVEFTLYKGTDEQIVNVKVPSTPIQRNWRTNIIGDLLTGEGFDIIIDEEFDNEVNQEIEISADGIVKDENGIYHITKAEGLWALANLVNNGSQDAKTGSRATSTGNTFDGKTFVLDCDIDLQGKEWTPMDNFNGTFDGNKKTIKNFTVKAAKSAGLFGTLGTSAVIKNLKAEDATIVGNHYAGVIAGYGYATIDNCHVKNSTVTLSTELIDEKYDNGDKAGAIIGYLCEEMGKPEQIGTDYVKNCTADHVTIRGYRDIGGLVGYANGTATVSNNTITNSIIIIDKTHNYKNFTKDEEFHGGEVVGRTGTKATVENNSTTEVEVKYIGGEDYKGYYVDANGKYIATESKGITGIIDEGVTEINLADGNFTMPEPNLRNKTLTIKGSKDAVLDVTAVDARDQFVTGATLSFEGITLDFGKVNYMGFANTASLTYKDCAINGLQFLFGENVTFENCDLNSNGAEHCVWTYGVKNVSFNSCNFTYGDRGINCYSDNDVDGGKQTVNFTNCTFATENTTSKGAVEINSTFFSIGIEVNLEDCKVPVYGEIAYISEWDSTGGVKTVLTIDGLTYVAKDLWKNQAGEYVANTADALVAIFNNIKTGDIIRIAKDLDMTGKIINATDGNKGFTLYGEGKTISNLNGSEQGLFVNHTGSADYYFYNVNLKNCSVNSTTNYGALFVGDADTCDELVIEGCEVNECTVNSNKYAAALVAYTAGYNNQNDGPVYSDITIKDCKVVGGSITGSGSTAAVIGHAGGNADTKNTITNLNVSGVTINGEDAEHTGIVVGTAHIGETIITDATYNDVIGNYNNEHPLYGRFVPNTTGKLTIFENGKQVFPVLVAFIGTTGYTSLDEALKVAVNGDEVMVKGGEYYPLNGGGKNITISAMENETVIFKLINQGEEGCDYGFGGNGTGVGTYVFNNITFDTTENTGNYKGYAYMGATYNNCNFVGAWSLNNANTFNFNNCTFDFKNGYFWTWGANEANFKGCTFNGNSKNILAHGWASTTINIEDCKFAATEKGFTGSGDNTACVEIDPAGTNTYTINFTGNNTKTESYAGWTRVKDGSTGHTITGIE